MWSALVRRWRGPPATPDEAGPAAAHPAAPAPAAGPGTAPAPAPATRSAADAIARGNAALAQGHLPDALQAYAQACEADPGNPAAWLNHGFVALELGDGATAQAGLRRCLALAARGESLWHEAQFLLGRACASEGRAEDAAAAFQAALAAAPDFEEARIALAQLWLEHGQAQRVPELVPAGPVPSPALALLQAQALHALGRAEASLAVLDQVLAHDPRHAPALDGRGVVLLDLDRPAEALASFEQALRAGGANADRLGNLSAACQRLARLDQAVAYADQALALDPQDARSRWNRALAYLQQGELARGWQDFEARWGAGVVLGNSRLATHAPRWQGEDLAGRSILLDMEQGLGDTIQFLRYVPELVARAARVCVRVQAPLVRLARRSLPQATVLAPGDAPPAVDFYCELMSVPLHVGIDVEAIPAPVPYLHPDPVAVRQWDDTLAAAAQGRLRVGLVWAGNPAHLNDRNRSIPLQRLRALAEVDALFVSMKPDASAGEREELATWPRLFDAGGQLQDFADTAALVQALDVLVCVDTSVAHLAGALARPVCLLLPWLPDWRWMLGREDSPWYPTMRLYRQAQPQDWSGPLQRVRADLERKAWARS